MAATREIFVDVDRRALELVFEERGKHLLKFYGHNSGDDFHLKEIKMRTRGPQACLVYITPEKFRGPDSSIEHLARQHVEGSLKMAIIKIDIQQP